MFELHSYDHYIVNFSGGKDSSCLLLYLLDQGIPREKIELWHQDIDGCGKPFFDWEITRDYCRRFAEAFGVPLYLQWKAGGFRRELMRENSLTAPTCFELPDGTVTSCGGQRGKVGTRLRFPQRSADLRTRWCSAYLKIDVCTNAIVNQSRFRGQRTLVLSGERGEESPQRARYAVWEPDPADLRDGRNYFRIVDRHRPLRDWTEAQVWALLEKYRVRVHPCYYMGWSRCSCLFCIFSNADQYASAACISPERMRELIRMEHSFGCTIHRNTDLRTLSNTGVSYPGITDSLRALASQKVYHLPVILPRSVAWELPAGAFGKGCNTP